MKMIDWFMAIVKNFDSAARTRARAHAHTDWYCILSAPQKKILIPTS